MISNLASLPRRGAWLAVISPLVALPLVLAGCGGSPSSASQATTTTVPGGPTSALAKYTQCLISHGVPASVADRAGFGARRGAGTGAGGAGTGAGTATGGAGGAPSGTGGAGGNFTPPTTTATERTARQDCASLRPTGGAGAFGGAGGFNSTAFAAYRNCLQLHGVTLPTTPPTTAGSNTGRGAGGGLGGLGGLRNNPAFAAANKACASLLPAQGSTTTTTTPSA